MNLADLISAGEAMYEALGREHYLTGAGLKAEAEFSVIYARFGVLMDDEALEAVRSSESRELLEWLLDYRIGRRTAEIDEQIFRWEQEATLEFDGQAIDYLRATLELANSPDREFRIALDAARAEAGADGLNALRRERFLMEHEVMGLLGKDYVEAFSELSGIDLVGMGRSATEFLYATQDMYAECLEAFVRRRLGFGVDELLRADIAWTFRGDSYDGAFQPELMLEIANRQMKEMGLDAKQGGRVRFDTEERDGKQPRAFCAPVRVPEEVYLVIRPQGGHRDYRTFWHELGHAMHFASTTRDLPFVARWLGDNSVTEGFAMLWDHLTLNPDWLQRYFELGPGQLRDLVFELCVHDLYLVRRYAAKLVYELSLHTSNFEGLGAEYADTLSGATLFRCTDHDYLADVDPGFYCVRYLRAWQLEAAVACHLRDNYDTDWFRNPTAGAFVQSMMAQGQSLPAHELVSSVANTPLSFESLTLRFESMLA